MAFGTPVDPVPGTVITVSAYVASALDPIRWLRLLTGNADPPGSFYVAVSTSTSGTAWMKVPADALAAGAALSNLGYTPVNRAGDLGLSGAIGWGASVYLSGANPNQLFLVSGQLIYLVDAANPGAPVATIDLVNKTVAMAGGSFSFGALTLTGALTGTTGILSGAFQALNLVATNAFQAASAVILGNTTVGGILSAVSAAISGNATVGGTLGVTGAQTNSSTLAATQLSATVADGVTPPVVVNAANAGVTCSNLKAALAANALQLNGVAPTSYARKDAASDFTTAPTINGAAIDRVAKGTYSGHGVTPPNNVFDVAVATFSPSYTVITGSNGSIHFLMSTGDAIGLVPGVGLTTSTGTKNGANKFTVDFANNGPNVAATTYTWEARG